MTQEGRKSKARADKSTFLSRHRTGEVPEINKKVNKIKNENDVPALGADVLGGAGVRGVPRPAQPR